MRWTGERVSSLLNLPRETAAEAATADDAVAWGCTLEKLQDLLNHLPDRRHPVAPGERRRFWRACRRLQLRFVTSSVAGLNIAKSRRPWLVEWFPPSSL